MSEVFEKEKQLQAQQFAFEEQTEQKDLFEETQSKNVFETKEETKQEESLADKFENASKREVIMARIDQKERVKTETVMKKKGIFGKKEAETQTYYQVEEQQVEIRQKDADSLKEHQDLRNDALADYRESLSLETKAACGYENVKNLSQFANIIDEEEVKKYGRSEDAPGRNEVMDKLTSRIMDMDPNAYSNLSDKAICQNAAALENMSAQVKAYRTLLSQNTKYVDKLKDTKLSGGGSQFDQLQKQMDILGAISDYYRIRKMILTDGEYINSTKNIGHDITEDDTASTVHLKEMLRMSYHLANRVNAVLGGDSDMPELREGETPKAKKVYGDVDNIFTAKTREVEKEQDGKKVKAQEERTKEDIEKDIRARIEKMEVQNLSSNSYEMRNEQKLSFEKKAREPISKYVTIYGLGATNTMNYALEDHFREHKTKAVELCDDYCQKNFYSEVEGRKNPSFDPRFKDAKTYTDLEKFSSMDNVARMRLKLPLIGQMAGLSDKEIMEWYAGFAVTQTTDFHEAKKDASDEKKAKEAEDKLAYMEEAFADATMKSLIYHNAMMEKLAETLGQDAFLLHPEDLAVRLTDEQWVLLTSAATISNIILVGNSQSSVDNNQAVRDFVKEYQSKHPDMAPFDVEKFLKAGNAYTALQFKLQTNTNLVDYLTTPEDEFCDDDWSYEQYKEAYGEDFNWDEIEEWYEQNKDDPQYAYSTNGEVRDNVKKLSLYFMAHPEKVKPKHIKVLNNATMDNCTRTTSADDQTRDIVALASEGLVKPRSIKELKKYESSLKKRDKSGTNIYVKDFEDGYSRYLEVEHDPYKMKLHYEMIVAYVDGKEKRGETVSEEEKKERQEAKALYDKINTKDVAQAEELKKWKDELEKKKQKR